MPIDYIYGTDLGARPQQPTMLDSLMKVMQTRAGVEQTKSLKLQNEEFANPFFEAERLRKAKAENTLLENQGIQAGFLAELTKLRKEVYDDPATIQLLKKANKFQIFESIKNMINERNNPGPTDQSR